MSDDQSENSNSANEEGDDDKPRLLRTWLRENSGSGWWFGIFLEAGLIVFSVLLALAVNEWRAEKVRAQKAQTALKAIRSEIKANSTAFENADEYHQTLKDTLRYYEGQNLTPPMVLLNRGIFRPAPAYNTAWETAKQSGIIDYLDYELVLDLSRLYRRQSSYKELGSSIGQSFYIKMTMEKSAQELLQGNYKNWIQLLDDFSKRERRLSQSNADIVKRLNKVIQE